MSNDDIVATQGVLAEFLILLLATLFSLWGGLFKSVGTRKFKAFGTKESRSEKWIFALLVILSLFFFCVLLLFIRKDWSVHGYRYFHIIESSARMYFSLYAKMFFVFSLFFLPIGVSLMVELMSIKWHSANGERMGGIYERRECILRYDKATHIPSRIKSFTALFFLAFIIVYLLKF